MEITSILGSILSGLAESLGSKIGDNVFGWLLGFIGGDNDAQFGAIEGQLKTLENDMETIEQDLNDITNELKVILEHEEWDTAIEAVLPSINDIDANYKKFQEIQQDDTATAAEIQQWALANATTELMTINNSVLPGEGGADPTQPGLIRMYANFNAQASVQDPGYARGAIMAGSPLDTYYTQIEQYFVYLVGVQVKGVTLLMNAYNAAGETDMAANTLATFQANLAQQCQIYLCAVEAFAVNYAPDASLLDIFGTPGAADPLQRATVTIDTISNTTTFYARMWTGNGEGVLPPFTSFSTVGWEGFETFGSNPISESAGNIPNLVNSSGTPLPADQINNNYGVYCVFPANQNCQWSMFRFSWTNPPDETYEIQMQGEQLATLFIGGNAVANSLIEPSEGRYFFSPLRTYTFNEQNPANSLSAVYSGRTSLPTFGYAGEAGAGQGIYNFGLNDFSVECWFYLPKPASAEMSLLSSKCEFGAGGNQEVPGASGFLLDLSPAGNSGYVITFTVDSGYGYYQISSAPTNLQDGRWHFIAGVRKNFQLELFLDGEPLKVTASENNAPNTIDLSSNWNLMFGCKNGVDNFEHFTGFLPVNLFPGYLNDVAVWNRALGTAEIGAHMADGPGPNPASLAGYWTFAGGTAMDQTGKVPAKLPVPPAMMQAPVFYPDAPAGDVIADQEEALSRVA